MRPQPRTHDIKRMLRLAQKHDIICIEYETETCHSWQACGKLTDFQIIRPEDCKKDPSRLADIKLVFDGDREYWAFGLERFADKLHLENFFGMVGTGEENQSVYLRIKPVLPDDLQTKATPT